MGKVISEWDYRCRVLTIAVCSGLFFYLFILQIGAIWSFTIDDMYIPLRYARHWADGYGLLWNTNEAPVEGYSNFSFVVLARWALLFGLNPVVCLKIVGLLGLFLSGVGVYGISRFWFSPLWSLIPPCWLLMYRGEIIWSVSGLETTLYQALIIVSVGFSIRALGFSWVPGVFQSCRLGSFVMAGLLLALAGMTRPEAPALMILFFCLLWVNRPLKQSRVYWQGMFAYATTYLVFFAPYFFWRWHYYGRLFPNPVYCKGVLSTATFALDGAYLKLVWPFFLIALPAIRYAQDRRHYFLWMPSLLYLILLMHADPIVAFDNRLFLPAFALLLPLVLQGLERMCRYYAGHQEATFKLGLAMSVCLTGFFVLPMLSLSDYRYFTKAATAGETLRNRVSAWIKNNRTEKAVIVLGDAGLIPYKIEQTFIDSYCLNNANMTKTSSSFRYERLCKDVLKAEPDLIILTAAWIKGRIVYAPADACFATVLPHHPHYFLQAALETADHQWGYRYEIFGKSNKISSAGSTEAWG